MFFHVYFHVYLAPKSRADPGIINRRVFQGKKWFRALKFAHLNPNYAKSTQFSNKTRGKYPVSPLLHNFASATSNARSAYLTGYA